MIAAATPTMRLRILQPDLSYTGLLSAPVQRLQQEWELPNGSREWRDVEIVTVPRKEFDKSS